MPDVSATKTSSAGSGVYKRFDWIAYGSGFQKQVVETARLDVDGWYPLMVASGSIFQKGTAQLVHWFATQLVETSSGVWEGNIRQRWGDVNLLPQQSVRIHVPRQYFPVFSGADMTITFTGGAPDVSRTLHFDSSYFRTVEFEFDTVETAPKVTSVDTGAHPNHPSNLRRETLNISKVYDRAGVEVLQSPNESVVGLEAGVGADSWNDQELHDAMQMFWSRYKPSSQWALWMLFAHRHDIELGPKGEIIDPLGQMFDHKDRIKPADPIQRQGAAIFGERIAEKVPASEANPQQWIRRERFFAAVHEIGHCFNLTHSWQKSDGNWLYDPGSPIAESFMNYPARANQAGVNFYGEFEYSFDEFELRFLRHAPDEFIQMGAAPFTVEHGYSFGAISSNPKFSFKINVSRSRPVFEFLEPVMLELELTNTSGEHQIVDGTLLEDLHNLTIAIQPHGRQAQLWKPYTRYCYFESSTLLAPGEVLRKSLFASAGLEGWYIGEPGGYTVYAQLQSTHGNIFSQPLTLRVASPQSWEEDYFAQNFFTDEVGRALAFGGTHVMSAAIETLKEATDRLKTKAVAQHAKLALALPMMKHRKIFRMPAGQTSMSSVGADGGKIAYVEARQDEARRILEETLITGSHLAKNTFGHLSYQKLIHTYAHWLEQAGDKEAAVKAQSQLSKGF